MFFWKSRPCHRTYGGNFNQLNLTKRKKYTAQTGLKQGSEDQWILAANKKMQNNTEACLI
jgi:hypothetical protein